MDISPVNIISGNSVLFTAEFFDSHGNATDQVGGLLSINYTNINYVTQTDTLALRPDGTGRVFTGSWSSTNAVPGLAYFIIRPAISSAPMIGGILRVVDE